MSFIAPQLIIAFQKWVFFHQTKCVVPAAALVPRSAGEGAGAAWGCSIRPVPGSYFMSNGNIDCKRIRNATRKELWGEKIKSHYSASLELLDLAGVGLRQRAGGWEYINTPAVFSFAMAKFQCANWDYQG